MQVKVKKELLQDSNITHYLKQVCSLRPKLDFGIASESQESINFYKKRVEIDEKAVTVIKHAKIASLQRTVIVQSKSFPALEVTSSTSESKIDLKSKFEIARVLLTDTAFHRETLDRLGLLKPVSVYEESTYISEQQQPQN